MPWCVAMLPHRGSTSDDSCPCRIGHPEMWGKQMPFSSKSREVLRPIFCLVEPQYCARVRRRCQLACDWQVVCWSVDVTKLTIDMLSFLQVNLAGPPLTSLDTSVNQFLSINSRAAVSLRSSVNGASLPVGKPQPCVLEKPWSVASRLSPTYQRSAETARFQGGGYPLQMF
jgi:hypothetical protein